MSSTPQKNPGDVSFAELLKQICLHEASPGAEDFNNLTEEFKELPKEEKDQFSFSCFVKDTNISVVNKLTDVCF